MLFECLKQDASQRIILIVQTNPSKGVQENILKAWNFTTYKLHHRYVDNNLQKNFRTNILESDTADTLDSCFNCRIIFISPKLENDSIFTYCQRNITCRGNFWIQPAISDGTFCENSFELVFKFKIVFKLALLFFQKNYIVDISRA